MNIGDARHDGFDEAHENGRHEDDDARAVPDGGHASAGVLVDY